MKYKYITTIDRTWNKGLWLAGDVKLLTPEEAKQPHIKPFLPKRIALIDNETLEAYCERQLLAPEAIKTIQQAFNC